MLKKSSFSKKLRYTDTLFQLFILILSRKLKILNIEVKDLNRLKVVLAEQKRTETWLAQELGVSYVTVSKWCTNTTQPGLNTLDQIAKLLSVDVSVLLNKTECN